MSAGFIFNTVFNALLKHFHATFVIIERFDGKVYKALTT